MMCCRSCIYWTKASKRIPIDVVKKIDKKNKIVIEFMDKKVRIPSWKWVILEPEKFNMAKYMRFCFYGKGAIYAWDKCEYYEPITKDKLYCEVSSCEYYRLCPKYREKRPIYIS